MKYRPRNDFVVYRLTNRGEVRGIAMPDTARQGKELTVEAVGPKVEGLKVGDRVLVIGDRGQDNVPLPDDPNLFLTREANVVLILED